MIEGPLSAGTPGPSRAPTPASQPASLDERPFFGWTWTFLVIAVVLIALGTFVSCSFIAPDDEVSATCRLVVVTE